MVRHRTRGFTLIELLVAISLMALMAALSWRGLDGMTRAQTQMRQHSDAVLALQAALAQWGADLDALASQPNTPSLDWDGRVLRLTRMAPDIADGLQVDAWTRRFDSGGQWLRWQSPPSREWDAWQQSWNLAALWAQNPSSDSKNSETAITPLLEWQIFYYRNNAWSNPLSSEGAGAGAGAGGAAAPPASAGAPAPVVMPDGIRLVLALPPGQGLTGKLTQDWVKPD